MGPLVTGSLVSLNVGPIREVEWFGRTVETAIWKEPVEGSRQVGLTQIDGDRQADLRVHGGPDKAVYAYASEDLTWWAKNYGQPFPPGVFGENLTTEGIEVTDAVVGERWKVGTAVLEVCQPREPCFKLGIRLGDAEWVERFDDAFLPGAYLRVVEPGTIEVGDAIEVVTRPDDGFTVTDLLAVRSGEASDDLLRRVSVCEATTASWREKARRALVDR